VEIPTHPFFIACQFHPEFLSKPNHPHPIFHGFVKAAMNHHGWIGVSRSLVLPVSFT
jgi:CTP synthase